MAVRSNYATPDIQNQSLHVLALADQLKNSYKDSIWDPANTNVDIEKQFAPSHLFFTDKDLYYSDSYQSNDPYVYEFLEFDDRAPHRGYYKRTEVGLMFPHIVKDEDVPTPGSPLVWKRPTPVSIWQDESLPIPDIHFRNVVDFHQFDFAKHFLNSSDYFAVKNAVFDAMRKGNATIEKLWVDTFIANVLGVWAYPKGDRLYRFFTRDDNYTPTEAHSKNARQFYLNDGEVKKNLDIFAKHVKQNYVARFPYLTNLNTHEVIGQALDKTVPAWDKLLADRSDAAKTLKWLRGCLFDPDAQNKSNKVGYNLRRQSVECISSAIFQTIDRMLTNDARNWCGHKFGKDVKDIQARDMQCKAGNLLVLMNPRDLTDMFIMKGSEIKGPFTEEQGLSGFLEAYMRMGVRFHGVKCIIPGMAVVVDKICFRLLEYFNESYSQFFPYDLVDATVHHMFKKPLLYRYVACNVVEPGVNQKFAVGVGWGSEHLPFLRET